MKRQRHYIIDQEDVDASSYPLYPSTEGIFNKAKKEGKVSLNNNIEITALTSKISEWHEEEYNPDLITADPDVPGAELDDKLRKNRTRDGN